MLEDRLLADRTAAQRAAIVHDRGPLLIIAGAGTGKTTVITRRIAWLVATKRAKPEEILALTFTDKAAAEMEERVDVLVPYGYLDMSISTFHAFGDRLLREHALEAGLSPHLRVLSKAEQIVFLREHLFELPLERLRPLTDPDRYLPAIATVISRAKDEAVTVKEFLAYAKKIRAKAAKATDDVPLRSEAVLARELSGAYETYQRLLRKADAVDFGDQVQLLLQLFEQHPELLEQYRRRFTYILVDEFQDTNFAQFRLLQLFATPASNVTVVADDDQCVPKGTLVETPDGPQTIERIQVGDDVLTAVGKGHVGTAKVTKVFRSVKPVRLLTLKTKTGQCVRVTDNHKMFCYIPSIATQKHLSYVYLMHRRALGWRLGVTNDLATRLRLERSADLIVGLRAFNSESEARFHETLWSLTYGIPTTVFKARTGIAIRGELAQRLHAVLDTDRRVQQLARDLHIDLNAYHVCLDGVHRGGQRRVKINLTMCDRRHRAKHAAGKILKNPSVLHTVRIQTSHPEAIQALQATGVPLRRERKGHSVRLAFADLQEAGRTAEQLVHVTQGILETKFALGRFHYEHLPALLMPAKNVLRGHYIPVLDAARTHIQYDEVVEITEEVGTHEVFDLEVERVHNFIASRVVVHNSIYKWRGAAISNVLKFLEHYRKVRRVVLTENFRSSQAILDAAYRLIRHNDPDRLEVKEKIDKRLVAMRPRRAVEPKLEVFDTASSEADWVAKQIEDGLAAGRKPGDFAVLVRTNQQADLFLRALNVSGIPWRFSGSSGLFAHDDVRMLLSALKTLADPEDSLSWYHVASSELYGIPMEDLAKCLAQAKRTNKSLKTIFTQVLGAAPEAPEVGEEARKVMSAFMDDVKRLLELSRTHAPGQLLYRWLTDTGWLKRHATAERTGDVERLQVTARFFDQLYRFEHLLGNRLPELMRSLELLRALGDVAPAADDEGWAADDRVNVLTIHKAKGLEFPVVFLVGLVQGRFPTPFRREALELPEPLIKDLLPTGDYHLQEERRLFYVGMTRAKEVLHLTAAYDYGGKSVRKVSQFALEALQLASPTPPAAVASLKDRLERLRPAPPAAAPPGLLPMPEPLRLDAHGMDDYLTCPMKFKFSHVLRIPIMRHHLVIYGAALHKAVEVFYKRQMQGKPMSQAELLETFEQAWSSEGFLTQEHERRRLAKGRDVLRTFFATQQQHPEQPTLIEEKFSIQVDDFVVVGRWDRVDRHGDDVVIIDYKSSDVTDQKKADARTRESLQLAVYALAWHTIHGQLPSRLELRFLETGLTGRAGVEAGDLEETKDKLRSVAKGLRALEFHPQPSDFACRWCAYQAICSFSAI